MRTRMAGWLETSDALGRSGDVVRRMLEQLLAARRVRQREVRDLADALIVPAGLCSVSASAIPSIVELIERSEPAAKIGLLSILKNLADEAGKAQLQQSSDLSAHLGSSIVSITVMEQICVAATTYSRLLEGVMNAKRTSDLHVLAADLLSRSRVHPAAGIAEAFVQAIVKERRRMHQALLIVAARKIFKGHSAWPALLERLQSDGSSGPVVQFLTACFSVADLHDNSAEVLDRLGAAIQATADLDIGSALEATPRDCRYTIYKVIVDSPSLPYPQLIHDYVFELLRASFNDQVRYTGFTYSTGYDGRQIVKYHLVGPESQLPADLSDEQRQALQSLLQNDWVWRKDTNFWHHFGLVGSRSAISELLKAGHRGM